MKKLSIYFWFSCIPLFLNAQFDYALSAVAGYEAHDLTFFTGSLHQEDKTWKFGANFDVKLFQNIQFRTGLRYSQFGYTTKLFSSGSSINVGSDQILLEPSGHSFNKKKFRRRYIEVPLVLQPHFQSGRFTFFVEFGLTAMRHLSSIEFYSTNNLSIAEDVEEIENGLKRLILLTTFSVGAGYSLNEKYQIFAQSVFRKYEYNLTVFTATRGPNLPFSALGIEFGLRRGFTFKPRKGEKP